MDERKSKEGDDSKGVVISVLFRRNVDPEMRIFDPKIIKISEEEWATLYLFGKRKPQVIEEPPVFHPYQHRNYDWARQLENTRRYTPHSVRRIVHRSYRREGNIIRVDW